MKIVFTSDIHMSNSLPFSKIVENGCSDRLLEQRELWKQIYSIIKKNRASALFVLGDLFDHSRVDAVTLTEAVKAVVSCPVPVYLLPGNHDATTTSGGRFTVEAFAAMRNEKIHVIGDDLKPLKFGNSCIFSVSFRTRKETEKIIKKIIKRLKRGKKNILLLHCSILGAKAYGWECDDGINPKLFKSFDYVFAGHFHDSQAFSDNGFYIGSPMQHHFGDVGSPCQVLVADFENNYFQEPSIDMPMFHVLDFDNFFLKRDADNIKKGDFVRFEIEANHSDWVKKKMAVEELCTMLKEKKGWRVDYKYSPISQSSQRIALPNGGGAISLKKAITQYVRATETQLNAKRLIKLGKDILSSSIKV